MKYLFRESKLGPDFAKEKIKELKKLIENSISFTLASMPGVGTTVLLRYLTTLPVASFVFVDTYNLMEHTSLEVFKQLLSELGGKVTKNATESQILPQARKKLKDLTLKNKRVVIVFNRFDQLKKVYSNEFFEKISSLRSIKNDQIVLIFTANKPLSEILPSTINSYHINLLAKTVYVDPFSFEDIYKIIKLYRLDSYRDKKYTQQTIKECGGHNQLTQLYLKSEASDPLTQDRFLKFQLKELYDYLNYHQKRTVQKLVYGKKVENIDPYLVKIGLVRKTRTNHQLFSPLLSKYVAGFVPFKLPVKENKLFRLLLKSIDLVVLKEEIFKTVWEENPEDATDWALNALIYRLRKNPSFAQSGYMLESYKKQGYKLISV